MRLIFLGKGGSGKTTLSSMFAMHCIRNGSKLLTIDGDVNIHLGMALRVPENDLYLSNDYPELFKALEGEHPYFIKTQIIPGCGSLPPSQWSNLISLDENNLILRKFTWKSKDHSWWHIKLGDYGAVHSGGDCYHFKQNALELFVHRINDSEFDIVMTDATAGIDHLATSLVRAYDLCIFSVEPTTKSVSVAKDFLELSQKAKISVLFIANKIDSEDDIKFISQNLNYKITGSIAHIEGLGYSESDEHEILSQKSMNMEELFKNIINVGADCFKFRQKQLNELALIYKKECTGYWNSYSGIDLLPYLEGVE